MYRGTSCIPYGADALWAQGTGVYQASYRTSILLSILSERFWHRKCIITCAKHILKHHTFCFCFLPSLLSSHTICTYPSFTCNNPRRLEQRKRRKEISLSLSLSLSRSLSHWRIKEFPTNFVLFLKLAMKRLRNLSKGCLDPFDLIYHIDHFIMMQIMQISSLVYCILSITKLPRNNVIRPLHIKFITRQFQSVPIFAVKGLLCWFTMPIFGIA